MGQFGVGQSVRRKEDVRLLTGGGRFLDDISLPDEAHAFVLRSPHAHANIGAIDTSAARDAPGVIAVLTGADVEADGLGGIICLAPVESKDGREMPQPPHPLLARGRVRCVGDGLAMVIADSPAQAKDAAERIVVDYDPLPAVIGTADAASDGAPQVWDEAPNNTVFDWELGDKAAVDAAFAAAAQVSTIDLVNQRVVVNSIEPRGAMGRFDPATGLYTLHTPTQMPHMAREVLAGPVLHVEPDKLRVVSTEVGGGFGMKAFVYVEQALVLWAAKKVGRPVKWQSERAEAFLCDTQGRDQVTHAELALDGEGKFLALRVSSTANLGAYLSNFAPMIATVAGNTMLTGLYAIPAAHVEVKGVFTNTVLVDAYRGAGRPEASYVIERLVDTAARDAGLSPDEIRRRNFVPPEMIPHTTPLGVTFDSGNFIQNMEDAAATAGWAGFEARRKRSAARGMLRGIGIGAYVETAGAGPDEGAEVIFEDDGSVTVLIGTMTNGQGHATSYSQVLEDILGLPFESINIVQGDTARIATGGGTGGSRSMMHGGVALKHAADKIIEKGRKIAAHVLEAAEADVEFAGGSFTIIGTDRRLSVAEVAAAAKDRANLPEGLEPGLDAAARSEVEVGTYPNGCHICEVEIDPETGACEVVNYTVADDFGRVVNPLLVEGQVHGGVAQGAGQALLEACVYDPESGQLMSGSFMDYALPRADTLPAINFEFNEVLCTTNPLGIKGAGEAGTVGALAAVINAVVDALSGLGVRHIEMPATPARIWQAIAAAREDA